MNWNSGLKIALVLSVMSVSVCWGAVDRQGLEPLIWMTFNDDSLASQGSLELGAFTETARAAYVDSARPWSPRAAKFGADTGAINAAFAPMSPGNLNIPIQNFTFSAYGTIGTKDWGDLVSFAPGGHPTDGRGWRIERTSATGFAVYALQGDTAPTGSVTSGTTYHHLAVTVDAAKNYRLYVDGRQVATGTVAASITKVDQFRFGRAILGTGNPATNARMDDFRIYGQALTGEQVHTLYEEIQTAFVWQGGGTTEEPADWSDDANWVKASSFSAPQLKNGNGNPFLPVFIKDAVITVPESFLFEGYFEGVYPVGLKLQNAQVTINNIEKLQSGGSETRWIQLDEKSSLVVNNTVGTISSGANFDPGFDVKSPSSVVFETRVRANADQRAIAYRLHERGSVAYNQGLVPVSGSLTHQIAFTLPEMDREGVVRKISEPRTLIHWAETAPDVQTVTVTSASFPDATPVAASAIDLTGEVPPAIINTLAVGSYTIYKDVSGVHVVYIEPVEPLGEYTADLGEADRVLWSAIAWDGAEQWQSDAGTVAALRNAAAESELILDEPITAARVAISGSGPLTILSETPADTLTGLLDLSGIANGGATVGTSLNTFPILPPDGISLLSAQNSMSGVGIHGSGMLSLSSNLGTISQLYLDGGNLHVASVADIQLPLLLQKAAELNVAVDISWLPMISGGNLLTKTGPGSLTFTTLQAFNGLALAEGPLCLQSTQDAGANGLLLPGAPITVAPGARLILQGTNTTGTGAGGRLTLADATDGATAVVRIEGEERMKRPITFGNGSAIQIADSGTLTLDGQTLSVHQSGQIGRIEKSPDAETTPTVYLRGTVTALCGDSAQWTAGLQIHAKLLSDEGFTGNLTKTGSGNLNLAYGNPRGGDASRIGTLASGSYGGTLAISGAVVANATNAGQGTAITVTPQRGLTYASLTTGTLTFATGSRLDISTHVSNLFPGRYTLVKWTGDATPSLPPRLPNQMYVDPDNRVELVPGWELVLDMEYKAIVLQNLKPSTTIILY